MVRQDSHINAFVPALHLLLAFPLLPPFIGFFPPTIGCVGCREKNSAALSSFFTAAHPMLGGKLHDFLK